MDLFLLRTTVVENNAPVPLVLVSIPQLLEFKSRHVLLLLLLLLYKLKSNNSERVMFFKTFTIHYRLVSFIVILYSEKDKMNKTKSEKNVHLFPEKFDKHFLIHL